MQYMKSRAKMLGHVDSLERGFVASLSGTDERMYACINDALAFGCQVLTANRILMDGLLILAMRGN